MMNNFQELLDRYINRTATDEEKEAFFALLESGQYDEIIIRESLHEVVEADFRQASDDEKILYESRKKIYESLIQKIRISHGSKIVPIDNNKWRLWMAAAVVVMVVTVGYLSVNIERDKVSTDQVVVVPQQAPKPGIYSGKQVVDLPDGTRVILNEHSELSYDQSFGFSDREVTLSGEASFDVTNDPLKPFIVRTGKVNTKVLGTSFNISAYPEQNQVTVTVLRGLVEVSNDQQIYGKISPDQQIAVNTTTYDFVRKNTKAKEEVAWQNNFLILDDVTLDEAAARIGEKFHISITFDNPALKKCKFYGSFLNDETLADILNMMSPVLHISYKIENDNVIISGKGCNEDP